jgi:hypothetical protein
MGACRHPAFPAPFLRGANEYRRDSGAMRSEDAVARLMSRVRAPRTASFPDGPKDQTRNREIPGSMLSHRSGMTVQLIRIGCLTIEILIPGGHCPPHPMLTTATASDDSRITDASSCAEVAGRSRQATTLSVNDKVGSKKADS